MVEKTNVFILLFEKTNVFILLFEKTDFLYLYLICDERFERMIDIVIKICMRGFIVRNNIVFLRFLRWGLVC